MAIEVECFRHNPTYVKLITSNGSIQLRKQCQLCGKLEGKIYKHSEVEDLSLIPLVDEVLVEKHYKELQSLWKIKSGETAAKWNLEMERRLEQINHDADANKQKYHDYLKSDEWFDKRSRIMSKYKFKCVLCFKPADVVHHLTYIRVYEEDERDMIPLCDSCHKFVHGYNKNSIKF